MAFHLHGGVAQDGVLQPVERLLDLVQHGEVLVHDVVDQGVGQVVGAPAADAAAAGFQPLADGLKQVPGVFLEGDHRVVGQVDRDLLHAHLPGGLVEGKGLGDKEYALLVGFQFRALVYVHHVLQGQGVHAVATAQFLDQFHLVQPAHVVPGHLQGGAVFGQGVHQGVAVEAFRAVVGQVHVHVFHFLAAGVD